MCVSFNPVLVLLCCMNANNRLWTRQLNAYMIGGRCSGKRTCLDLIGNWEKQRILAVSRRLKRCSVAVSPKPKSGLDVKRFPCYPERVPCWDLTPARGTAGAGAETGSWYHWKQLASQTDTCMMTAPETFFMHFICSRMRVAGTKKYAHWIKIRAPHISICGIWTTLLPGQLHSNWSLLKRPTSDIIGFASSG